MLYEFAGQDYDEKIFHSMKGVKDYADEEADREVKIHDLAYDDDDLNSFAVSSAQTGETLSHYLIIREDRPEFNLDVFADGFFYGIKVSNANKSLGIKSDVDDIVQRLLIDADVR